MSRICLVHARSAPEFTLARFALTSRPHALIFKQSWAVSSGGGGMSVPETPGRGTGAVAGEGPRDVKMSRLTEARKRIVGTIRFSTRILLLEAASAGRPARPLRTSA